MTPFQYWKKNNFKPTLRKLTREFSERFKVKSSSITEVGKIYAITYSTDYSIPTDKHHVTPVILSFGRFLDDNGNKYVRAVNLLYLSTKQQVELLEECYSLLKYKPGERVQQILKLHQKYMMVYPYAFKNFEERRIRSTSEVIGEDWGTVTVIQRYLLGNFNAVALNEDFQKEIKSPPDRRRKPKKAQEQPEDEIEDEIEDGDFIEGDLIDLDID